MITSSDNPKVKYIAKLLRSARFRREEGVFVAEGLRMVRETPAELLRKVYLSESASKGSDFPDAEIISDRVYGALSDTVSPQGVLALVNMPEWDVRGMVEKSNPLLIFLENLQDPGNLGTILRTAEAAGAAGIIADKNTADIFNPKVVRSTMGAVYRVPFVAANDLAGAIGEAKEAGVAVYAAHLKGSVNYCDCDYTGPAAFIIGNEGGGLTDETAALADRAVFIPMEGQAESLNAAMAAGILMYEARRQRERM